MMDRKIESPVVILVVSGRPYIWDGWHRVGACFSKEEASISAIVGIPKNELRPSCRPR